MIIKLGINGFNSLGRTIFSETKKRSQFQVVAINDKIKNDAIAYKLKYETIYLPKNLNIEIINNDLIVDGDYIKIFNKDTINWDECDVIIETYQYNKNHLKYGDKKVCFTYIHSNEIPIFIMGVNDFLYKNEKIISIANSTINCISVLLKIIYENFEFNKCIINNFDSVIFKKINNVSYIKKNLIYFNNGYKLNIISLKCIEKLLPNLKNKLLYQYFTSPVNNISLLNFYIFLKNKTNLNKILSLINNISKNKFKGIIDYYDNTLISLDYFINNKCTLIVDKNESLLSNGELLKLSIWHNNEYALSNKLLDFIKKYLI